MEMLAKHAAVDGTPRFAVVPSTGETFYVSSVEEIVAAG